MGGLVVQAEDLLQPLERPQHQHRHAQAGDHEDQAGGHDDAARREHCGEASLMSIRRHPASPPAKTR
ncbi:hypothetical protein [Brevundimonas sp. SH203]|uniref:hypothetical protein n=1 Tax=Brevundimonas sp. SH203 TaxID=345167 RepID=UPI0013562D11|nr:hypothetical protein [Brevundimonas sp. SH203]